MFEGFQLSMIDTGEAVIRVRYAGHGPGLLLLHGHPQTHVMWHKIAPRLAQHFTVVAANLRGYGESSKPPTTPDHEPYSKRAMARDQVEVMRQLGFEQFSVAGHDRGGYCAYRIALDHPQRVSRLALFDNIPIGEAFRRTTREFALGWYHWFFFAQPDLPGRLILENPDNFYRWGKRMRAELPAYFTPEAVEDYRRCVYNPDTICAMIEEYRAGATYDFALDKADLGKKRISCPMLVLTCLKDDLKDYFDIEAIWREWADDVRFESLDAGHCAAEERPEETYRALFTFFTAP
ncbi:hydrolase [Ktedonobacter sp. SOSP1-52]|uniref:alpha/beta fold hydrolase n=1 Tax=Ktedonobacter sp. SOSP1-52 TaxID=2778366 RepID=UPI0019162FFC|nr:alpha/beta hydrolase [Ktedonobacter sp. SOSP1-52]GHO70466.1 hydrolase [Ktedonobacter sp. SOSP1-52]